MMIQNPTQQLWVSVINQAIEDAIGGVTALNYPKERERAKSQARAWLTTPSHDFNEVCALAGLEPDQVRAYAVKRITQADQGIDPSKKQPKKNRPKKRFFEFNGKTKSVKEWADEVGMNLRTLNTRLRSGMDIATALTVPVLKPGDNMKKSASKHPNHATMHY